MGQYSSVVVVCVVLLGQPEPAPLQASLPTLEEAEEQAAREEVKAVCVRGATTIGLLGSPFGQGPLLASSKDIAEYIRVIHDAYEEQCTARIREIAAGRGSIDFTSESS